MKWLARLVSVGGREKGRWCLALNLLSFANRLVYWGQKQTIATSEQRTEQEGHHTHQDTWLLVQRFIQSHCRMAFWVAEWWLLIRTWEQANLPSNSLPSSSFQSALNNNEHYIGHCYPQLTPTFMLKHSVEKAANEQQMCLGNTKEILRKSLEQSLPKPSNSQSLPKPPNSQTPFRLCQKSQAANLVYSKTKWGWNKKQRPLSRTQIEGNGRHGRQMHTPLPQFVHSSHFHMEAWQDFLANHAFPCHWLLHQKPCERNKPEGKNTSSSIDVTAALAALWLNDSTGEDSTWMLQVCQRKEVKRYWLVLPDGW